MPDARLVASSIRKSFAGVRALKGVTFELKAGEVHALVGENGAGKSTLIKIMTGAERADGGTLTLDDVSVDLTRLTPSAARDLGVAVVYQTPALFPHLSVGENIMLSLGKSDGWRPIRWRRRRGRAAQLLERAGARFGPDRLAGSLSMPEQQLVEIARAIGARARVILMDEPTASLTDREVEQLFEVITALRQSGAGIIYISHRLDEVFRIADRITVLRDGETIVTDVPAHLTRTKVVHLMAGRPLDVVFPKRAIAPGPIALEVQHLSCAGSGLRDISLSVRRGEVVGVAGLVGSGRSELAEVLFGLRHADEGEIHVNGVPVTISSPADAIRHGLAYVPEDRRRHGVIADMPVAANTSLAVLDQVSRHGLLDQAAERVLADRFVQQLQIKTSSIDAPVRTLSGGNQQKVAMARWLATNPDVLILDEPTQGVDVGAKAELHGVMQAMAERGLAILMISSDLPEILGMSDRIVVMREGRIAGRLKRAEATAEAVLALAIADATPVPSPVEVR